MRPTKLRQSHLLQPLNRVLGTEANVRLVRVLALSSTPVTSGELAKRALLGRTSIYPALRELERAGIVEFVGAGTQRQVQLRDRNPLAGILRQLFRAEAHRFEALIVALRELLSGMPHRPASAWISEPSADAQGDDTLELYLVARPEDLETLTDLLNVRLIDLERKYDVHFAVHALTRTDLETLHRTRPAALSTQGLVAGVPPAGLLGSARAAAASRPVGSHGHHDERSRRLALAVAAKIRRDPGIVATARDRIERRAQKAGSGERRELAEWMRILSTMSPARLQRFLREESERAVRLRQTLPALNVLSPAEREAVVRSHTDAEAVAAVTRK